MPTLDDHLTSALVHLKAAAADDSSFKLFERDYPEWHRRQMAAGVARAAINIIEEHYIGEICAGQSDQQFFDDLRQRRDRGQHLKPVDQRAS